VDDVDRDKVDEIVLALMQLTLHDSYRAWKGFEWETLERSSNTLMTTGMSMLPSALF